MCMLRIKLYIFRLCCVAISIPRVARSGYPLPSARLVSAVIHWDFDIPHHMHTLMLMQVGQFVDHDLTRTAISKLAVNARGRVLDTLYCSFFRPRAVILNFLATRRFRRLKTRWICREMYKDSSLASVQRRKKTAVVFRRIKNESNALKIATLPTSTSPISMCF